MVSAFNRKRIAARPRSSSGPLLLAAWSGCLLAAALQIAGCAGPPPPGPPGGLRGEDVIGAAEQMAADLLSQRFLDEGRLYSIVFRRADNETETYAGSLDIFVSELRGELSENSGGRVRLVENRGRIDQMRREEVRGPVGGDDLDADFILSLPRAGDGRVRRDVVLPLLFHFGRAARGHQGAGMVPNVQRPRLILRAATAAVIVALAGGCAGGVPRPRARGDDVPDRRRRA